MREDKLKQEGTRMIHVRLSEELHKRVRISAAESDMTIQEWVAMAIKSQFRIGCPTDLVRVELGRKRGWSEEVKELRVENAQSLRATTKWPITFKRVKIIDKISSER